MPANEGYFYSEMIDEMQEQYPGWPHDYKQLRDLLLFPGISNDYPYIAWALSSKPSPAYLVPASLKDATSLEYITKSQQNKVKDILACGQTISAVVSKNPNDPYIKAVKSDHNKRPGVPIVDHNAIRAYCIFFDTNNPPRYSVFVCPTCITTDPSNQKIDWLGVNLSPALLARREWTPHVVYEVHIQCSFTWTKTEERPITNMQGHYLVDRLIKFMDVQTVHETLVKSYERQIYDVRTDSPTFQLRQRLKYKQRPRLEQQTVWYFEGRRVFRPFRQRTPIRILPGCTIDSVPRFTLEPVFEKRFEPMEPVSEGQRLTVNLWHNGSLASLIIFMSKLNAEISDFYLVECYVIAGRFKKEEEPEEQYQLPKRMLLDKNNEPLYQYLVNAVPSLYHNFYNCSQLGFGLIADPKRLLRNADIRKHPSGFPVWIRLEPDELRLAQFSIVALDKIDVNYGRKERAAKHPDIHGHGILVDADAGIVFSAEHPQTRIRLTPSDRERTSAGQQFHFVASFYGQKKGFVVCGIRHIREGEDAFVEGMEIVRLDGHDDTVFFKLTLKPYMRQWVSEGHYSPIFGPVTDPRMLYRNNAYQNGKWLPECEALVCLDKEWVPGKEPMMTVYSLVGIGGGGGGEEPPRTSQSAGAAAVEQKPQQQQKQQPSTSTEGQQPTTSAAEPCTSNSRSKEEGEEKSKQEQDDDQQDDDVDCGCIHPWGLLKEICREGPVGDEDNGGGMLEPELVELMMEMCQKFAFLATGKP